MNHSKYVLALDVGERRIGVALASSVARLAAPLCTIDQQKTPDVVKEIESLIQKEQADVLVIGLPRNLSGEDTAQTIFVREFAKSLSHLPVVTVLQDEAGTSIEAERLLKARGKPYAKEDIDAEAAALILQDYLNQSVRNTA